MKLLKKLFILALIMSLVIQANQVMIVPMARAQQVSFLLPNPGAATSLSQPYSPVLLEGIRLQSNQPYQLEFIVNTGDANLVGQQLEKESYRLINYFLASLTVPEDEIWVNLSPYERNRIIPDVLSRTEMGRDLLSQDYLLKQFTASLLSPENKLGSDFWKKMHKKMSDRGISSDISVDMFNRIWILPKTAVIYEKGLTAYIGEARLKVLLDKDYNTLTEQKDNAKFHSRNPNSDSMKPPVVENKQEAWATQLLREILIPEIEREVNEGKQFAQLRQIYNSLILAVWMKQRFKSKFLNSAYFDKEKVSGIDFVDKKSKMRIYDQYVKNFTSKANEFLKEEYDPLTQKVISYKYFSGGAMLRTTGQALKVKPLPNEDEHLNGSSSRYTLGMGLRFFDDNGNVIPNSQNAAMVSQVSFGDKWTHIQTEEIKTIWKKYQGILEGDDPLDKLESEYDKVFEQHLISSKITTIKFDQRKKVIDEIKKEHELAASNLEERRYLNALAWALLINEISGGDGKHAFISKLFFLSQYNFLSDTKFMDYLLLTIPPLFSVSPEFQKTTVSRQELKKEIESTFGSKATLRKQPYLFQVEPNLQANAILLEYRVMQSNDPEILEMYFHDQASDSVVNWADKIRSYLTAAAWAINNNHLLANRYIYGLIPIIKASNISLKDESFIEIQVSHLLNTKNLKTHRFAVLKLLESIPYQKRKGNKNILRETLDKIDSSLGPKGRRVNTLFRYLRVIFHITPSGSDFIRLMENLFVSIEKKSMNNFLNGYMDDLARQLFLIEEEKERFSRLENTVDRLLGEMKEQYKTETLEEFMSLREEDREKIISILKDQETKDDWRRLGEMWQAARETYLNITNGEKMNLDQKDIVKKVRMMQDQRRKIWKSLLTYNPEISLHVDIFSRKHIGETQFGYEGYQGVDAVYNEEKYESSLEEESVRSVSLEKLYSRERYIEDMISSDSLSESGSWEFRTIVDEVKQLIVLSGEELHQRGLINDHLHTLINDFRNDLSVEQLQDMIKLVDADIQRVFDLFNEKFRPTTNIIQNYGHLNRYQSKYTSRTKEAPIGDDARNTGVESLIGDILGAEKSFYLARDILRLAKRLLLEKNNIPSFDSNLPVSTPSETKWRRLGVAKISPVVYGSKFSILNVLIRNDIPVPFGGVLSTIPDQNFLQHRGEIEIAVSNLMEYLETKTGKQFPAYPKTQNFNPKKDKWLDPDKDILLTSVRSGSLNSMPGILDSTLNVGMNDTVVDFMLKKGLNSSFVYDSYRRSLNYYATNVLGIRDSLFVNKIDEIKNQKDQKGSITEIFSLRDYQDLINAYKSIILEVFLLYEQFMKLMDAPERDKEKVKEVLKEMDRLVDFDRIFLNATVFDDINDETIGALEDIYLYIKPWLQALYNEPLVTKEGDKLVFNADPKTLLINAVLMTYRSWLTPAARRYRDSYGLSDSWGTAVGIMEMKFGNQNDISGSGVIFTHEATTGRENMSGVYKKNSQGEDIVGGRTGNVLSVKELEDANPELFKKLEDFQQRILGILSFPQDIELVHVGGELFALQSRNMNIISSESRISNNIDREPLAKGEGASGAAVHARLLTMSDDNDKTRAKIKGLRLAMDASEEKDLEIILVSNYLGPSEATMLLEEEVGGVISRVRGEAAHATLVARQLHKLIITGVNFTAENSESSFLEGMKAVYTLDGNSPSNSIHAGEIFEGQIAIEKDGEKGSPGNNLSDLKDDESDAAQISTDYGGINFSLPFVNVDVKPENQGLDLPNWDNEMLLNNSENIRGCSPHIIHITPMNSIHSPMMNN